MTEPSLAAQRYVVARLKTTSAVTDLVPGANIFDRNSRPEVFPCIIVGEGQTIDESDGECFVGAEVFLDLDVWTRGNSLAPTKAIAGAVQRALRNVEATQDGVALAFEGQDTRFLRDPSGDHGHAIISLTINAEFDDA
ncbi:MULTISPECIES: DUF3168 domain-containing protein [Hyphomicrobiales]|uniref:DUF3168 domain-containing protein n=1 Tax=Methylobacterium sp. CCH7-A2 TaxID=1768789 RepID=UPI000AC1AEC9|nr:MULTISPECIES: DUF3168 domain-containing protein [Hyphomicrobiales]